jgi:hypothetical protein
MYKRFYSQQPKVVNYRNDGAGRDTYISFYNGGFRKYELNDTFLKEKTESPKHIYHQNLALCKPTKRYFTDGGGRDLYVYNSLKDENDKCKGNLRLNNILRSYDSTQYPIRTSKNFSPSKFEKKLINRIFYGKCPGLKDRLMSPKVKFLTKEDIIKARAENEEDEKNTELLPENKDEKNDLENKLNNRYDVNKYNACMTENNGTNMKNTIGMDINNSLFNLKKTPKKFRPEIGQTDNLVDSVKKIFLYNSKNKPHLYNNIKVSDLK